MIKDQVFGLDVRSKAVKVGDIILFSQDNENNVCKVLDIRCIEGNFEVRVGGAKGGWKRNFYKLAND